MGIKFVDSPPPTSGGGTRGNNKYVGILVQLISNHGRWALILHYKGGASAYSMPRRLRTIPGWGDGNVEFTARKSPGGGSDLYARYIGPEVPTSVSNGAGRNRATGRGEPFAVASEELGPNQV
jgi:hypothetical protein